MKVQNNQNSGDYTRNGPYQTQSPKNNSNRRNSNSIGFEHDRNVVSQLHGDDEDRPNHPSISHDIH
jgi:hypothetical protein